MTRRTLVALVLVMMGTTARLIAQSQPEKRQATATPDPRVARLLDEISEERLRSLLTTLVAFGTRNTLSDTASPTRGIGAARQWIFDELKQSSPRLRVSFDSHVLARQGRLTAGSN